LVVEMLKFSESLSDGSSLIHGRHSSWSSPKRDSLVVV
jgi:hypothetical protein